MKISLRYALAAALLASPVAAAAQDGPPPPHGEHGQQQRGRRGPGLGREGRGPIDGILAQREQLRLTDAQVTRLQAIQRDLQQKNAPLQQQLQSLFPRPEGGQRPPRDSARSGERRERGERPQLTAEQRQQMQQRREQARPVMERLQANGREAMEAARGVLTQAQKDQLRAQMEQRRERRGGEGREGRRGEGRQRPAAPQSR